ncbi:ATP-binding cassette domain-containing protein [Actinomadura sp. KC345]|uniref:ABC transporter ATP-binding protein n=1 Tax=Actinomadura sp. KC345 TaxID=2530371 RepID=UPI0010486FBD|nr:ATP-binding cassette domain-containing protein [Actinomadura sp. KC345]TDC57443.1 ATP-binding cassette domain-containing protein [Actinomadura sp. KC345]
MTDPVLTVRDLVVSYDGGLPAVSNYHVDLLPGTLTVILGRNGAGKTSTLRGITGFLAHETGSARGTISVRGKVVKRPGPLRLSKLGVGLVAERDKVFVNMAVQDQLRLVTSRKPDIDEIFDFFPRLRERRAVRAGLLSGGERQMLATALVLLRKPSVLLVDELSLGLAPGIVRELMSYLRRLADERGLTILAADQAVHASLHVADEVQVMDSGSLVASGPLDSLDIDAVLDAYLGRHER